MGLDLTYRGGERAFQIRFSMADWETIGLLQQHVPEAFEACRGVPDAGEPVQVSLAALHDGVDRVDRFLVEHPELLPYTYELRGEDE
jgi:hypothetical protein